MKTTRVGKFWSRHNLPAELWPDILSRLPVRSLVRFRCVSKSWKSLIDDTNFFRLHLNRFKRNADETHLFVTQGNHLCGVRCNGTFKADNKKCHSSISRLQHSVGQPLAQLWQVISSIDGLVMLEDKRFGLMLWNPSICKSRLIPFLPDRSSLRYIDLGLGIDPLTKDYKHVRAAFDDGGLHWIGIYTVACDSWRKIEFQGKGCSQWCWLVKPESKRICLNGNLYFIGENMVSRAEELVSFDMSNELFGSTGLPELDPRSSEYPPNAMLLAEGGRSLGVLDYSIDQASIWVLERHGSDNESVYWSKHYTFPVSIGGFFHLTKSGDALVQRWVKARKREVISYNIESQQERVLVKNYECDVGELNAWPYIESLIQP